MTTKQVVDMLNFTADEMLKHTNELCQLDSYIGDGDHGLTIERGFKAVKEVLSQKEYEKPAEVLKAVGNAVMNVTGGAIGPILGTFFSGCCKKIADCSEMDINEFNLLLSTGLSKIKLVGDAKEGDRTLVDALSPASAAFSKAAAEGESLATCLEKAASAAEEGAANTKNMVAQKGRAKFLGEKSLGYVDAGATSMSLIIRAMSNYYQQLIG